MSLALNVNLLILVELIVFFSCNVVVCVCLFLVVDLYVSMALR
jgi:hypothetical protein